MKAPRFLAAVALWLLVGAAHADFSGVVVSILDGDTVDVLVDRKPVRVRLAEIDAPEKAQPFGTRSRQALAAAVFQQLVTVQTAGLDRYGRTIGTVLVDGRSVNRMMVAQGMAWAYRQYLVDRSLLDVEAAARSGRVGLWVDPIPVCRPGSGERRSATPEKKAASGERGGQVLRAVREGKQPLCALCGAAD
jgi:endonuclease YncB( thermonuclease family)